MINMKKVLVGGTFNIIHPGHEFFLKKSKSLGDFLVVVIAHDKTVLKNKGRLIFSAKQRKQLVEGLRYVDKVVIGHESDFFRVVKQERPDIICLGYDQKMDEEKLKTKLKNMGLDCKVVRIKKLKDYSTMKLI
jgi:FAD synthetase